MIQIVEVSARLKRSRFLVEAPARRKRSGCLFGSRGSMKKPASWPARKIARYPKYENIPSRFWLKRSLRGAVSMNAFKLVVSKKTWYIPPSRSERSAGHGIIAVNDSIKAIEGGKNARVK